MTELDLQTQSRLVEALKHPQAFGHPVHDLQHLQTHISHVLLAGDYAYKIKKPLDLGFLDFSTLERRRHCCEEELRLNSRLAPSVYLEVVPVTGDPVQPSLRGDGPVLDYAVRMRRFPQDALLSRQQVDADLIERIAARAAAFHADIPAAGSDQSFGTPEEVFFPMQQNFDQIRALLDDPAELNRLEPLEVWTRTRYKVLHPLLERRKTGGHVRECHGDMHLGNIALVDGEVAIFDGIEFNPNLRWIDTMNEVAFLVMDLEQAGRHDLARRFLNRYLELSGDYDGLALLDFYKVYRALVRAKVTAIRLGQAGLEAADRTAVMAEYGRYIGLAEFYIQPHRAALLVTHGVSGSGKTFAGEALIEGLGAVRVRSDVERKRLFGLEETAHTDSPAGGGIYTPEAGARTYDRLAELAGTILRAGHNALVDATFLQHAQRGRFRKLAWTLDCPFLILDLQASDAELRGRVAERQAKGADASEADVAILERQLASRQPLDADEQAQAVALHSGAVPLEAIRARLG